LLPSAPELFVISICKGSIHSEELTFDQTIVIKKMVQDFSEEIFRIYEQFAGGEKSVLVLW
jgi:hypothetical protein